MAEIAFTAILHDGVLIEAGASVDNLPDDAKAALREVGSIGEQVIPAGVVDELAAKDALIAELQAKLAAASEPVEPVKPAK